MEERPILFNTEMVQAILDKKKSQTRRVIKPQTQPDPARIEWYGDEMGGWLPTSNSGKVGIFEPHSYKCPYGNPGDILYVRETWCRGCKEADPYCHCDTVELQKENHFYVYKADTPNAKYPLDWDDALADDWDKDADFVPRWKPSIHMPKNAARIWLEVIDVRVEKVQDITDEDATKEGCESYWWNPAGSDASDVNGVGFKSSVKPRDDFSYLWDSINKKRGFGWDTNPWVWVIDFNILSTVGKPETK